MRVTSITGAGPFATPKEHTPRASTGGQTGTSSAILHAVDIVEALLEVFDSRLGEAKVSRFRIRLAVEALPSGAILIKAAL